MVKRLRQFGFNVLEKSSTRDDFQNKLFFISCVFVSHLVHFSSFILLWPFCY